MIAGKMANQASVLSYFARYRKRSDPPLAEELSSRAGEIRSLSDALCDLDPTQDDIRQVCMGIEGRAASLYWSCIARLGADKFGFRGRITRLAKDRINQCLNYLYGMLYGEIWKALLSAGLDPYFGIIHGSRRDRGSLVFDFIEEFRAPFVDRVVMGLLGRRFIPGQSKGGQLSLRTRNVLAKAFIKHWRKTTKWRGKSVTPQEIAHLQAAALARMFTGSGEYLAYRFRW
jgi:CRISPR-associated protein Cas1